MLLPPPLGKNPPTDLNTEQLTLNIAKVNSMVEKVVKDTTDSSCDPVMITSLNTICDALKLLSENQAVIVGNLSNNSGNTDSNPWVPVTRNTNSYALVTGAKKSRTDTIPVSNTISLSLPTPGTPQAKTPPPPRPSQTQTAIFGPTRNTAF
jgi:hypothetical protein